MLEPIEYKATIGLELVSGDTYSFQLLTNGTPNCSITFRQIIDRLNRDDRAFSSPELKTLQECFQLLEDGPLRGTETTVSYRASPALLPIGRT